MLIGIIADTHNRLDAEVEHGLAGVDHILHAGDVCRPALLAQLELIAPVTVVAGNNDDYPGWRLTEVVELGGVRFLMQHIVDLARPGSEWTARIRAVRPDVAVFGHTHRSYCGRVDGVLYLNPGSAGAPRFGLPRTYLLAEIEGGRVVPRLVELPAT